MIEILAGGPCSTVQDQGRLGFATLGYPTAGAADRGSLRLGNRLLGNSEDAAGIEVTLGGLRVRFSASTTIAVTGAPCPVSVGARQATINCPVAVPAGSDVEIGVPVRGLRTYLAVRGGIAVPRVLGSRSSDLQSAAGLPRLTPPMVLPVGEPDSSFPNVDLAPVAPLADVPQLAIMSGPRTSWFAPETLTTLTSHRYLVTKDCDRVGIRLDGAALSRVVLDDLPSEGVVRGAIEVPPDGQPIILLAEYPTTCGYPVIAVLTRESCDLASQVRPGQSLSLRWVTPP